MPSITSAHVPSDYPQRVRGAREVRGLTQAKFAELVGVSYATVNRWENGHSRPNYLAWARILQLETSVDDHANSGPFVADNASSAIHDLDFFADPNSVAAVAEAHRLAYGHLFNSAFATETSLIDPLPHQRMAVYQRMLEQSPLRFLLADDAGAGKTIMAGLYIREMLARRLIRRVLVVSPAGLVGNWKREMRELFRLHFRIVGGLDARTSNPFTESESNLAIVSLDTLAGQRMFNHLRDAATQPYDLVIFDEAHKLSANRQPDFRVRKTDRYKLAEAIAGAEVDDERWTLPWSARHLLLLTATPHMGRDYPYYFLWRLLLPDSLQTKDAFDRLPPGSRRDHFVRRTKEEMVHFNGKPLYPQRNCDTLSYVLTQGPGSEQELYDETTDYILGYYNRARALNRSAARLAMSVFQRRLASSTYALMRSFERRSEKLGGMIEAIRNGRLTEEQLARQQRQLDVIEDPFDTQTADDDATGEDGREQNEAFEDQALEGVVAVSLAEIEAERLKVEELLRKARSFMAHGQESKFEKLQEVLRDPAYSNQRLILFTEHRDTATFLVRRLEGLGFTGQVASIHGGMDYQERERQVEFFRMPMDEGGANYLVATDAAGEGINLQFCWVMVNYDIPWNPARLEQRMGRIHRYGQTHDPVVIINLVTSGTREGQVMKTLLEKLEAIRREMGSDKVFDVIGRLFEGVSLKNYLDLAITGGGDEAVRNLEGMLTQEQLLALRDRERALYGEGGEVRGELDALKDEADREAYRRLIPGYVRRFVERTAPLLDLRIDGDLETTFTLAPLSPRAIDPLMTEFEAYPREARGRLTVYRPKDRREAVWLHPGEPIFDRMSVSIIDRYGRDGLRGAVFVDPYAAEPYLFHIAMVSIEMGPELDEEGANSAADATPLESRLVGLRQTEDGSVEEWPVEHLLLLKGVRNFAPGRVPIAALARGLVNEAVAFARDGVTGSLAQSHRRRLIEELPSRMEFVNRGFDFQVAELAAARARFTERAQAGDPGATLELPRIKERQRSLSAIRERRVAELRSGPERVRPGAVEFLVHALVVPAQDPEETERFDAEVEAVAMNVATSWEESFGATVKDVSRPDLARRTGLPDWPGFDLLSLRPSTERLAIEVKGRAGSGNVEMSENEWAKACNLRSGYWLYVVFDCATPHPRLVRVQDPFAKLLARGRESLVYSIPQSELLQAAESRAGSTL